MPVRDDADVAAALEPLASRSASSSSWKRRLPSGSRLVKNGGSAPAAVDDVDADVSFAHSLATTPDRLRMAFYAEAQAACAGRLRSP